MAIIWFISGIGSAICVLAHSGDGMGVSDVIGLRMGDSGASSGIVEKNLDRLTIICVVTFVLMLVLMCFLAAGAFDASIVIDCKYAIVYSIYIKNICPYENDLVWAFFSVYNR